ncbi:unnamed protein product [Protopolystoma xenopodis]|uniref:Uncharacterized protein n=1 Tax=Protopolystoma xenopodis TaxID=117903 RepID=A0A3S4ZXT1_9PLAT|nr:unnamed protein product [Protopolystoma xenopodis]
MIHLNSLHPSTDSCPSSDLKACLADNSLCNLDAYHLHLLPSALPNSPSRYPVPSLNSTSSQAYRSERESLTYPGARHELPPQPQCALTTTSRPGNFPGSFECLPGIQMHGPNWPSPSSPSPSGEAVSSFPDSSRLDRPGGEACKSPSGMTWLGEGGHHFISASCNRAGLSPSETGESCRWIGQTIDITAPLSSPTNVCQWSLSPSPGRPHQQTACSSSLQSLLPMDVETSNSAQWFGLESGQHMAICLESRLKAVVRT